MSRMAFPNCCLADSSYLKHHPIAGFLDLDALDIGGQIILIGIVHGRLFSSIPGLCPLDASSVPPV